MQCDGRIGYYSMTLDDSLRADTIRMRTGSQGLKGDLTVPGDKSISHWYWLPCSNWIGSPPLPTGSNERR